MLVAVLRRAAAGRLFRQPPRSPRNFGIPCAAWLARQHRDSASRSPQRLRPPSPATLTRPALGAELLPLPACEETWMYAGPASAAVRVLSPDENSCRTSQRIYRIELHRPSDRQGAAGKRYEHRNRENDGEQHRI